MITWEDIILSARKKPDLFTLKITKHSGLKDIKTGASHLSKSPKRALTLKQVRMHKLQNIILTLRPKKSYYGQ